jgi:hypothetical protein
VPVPVPVLHVIVHARGRACARVHAFVRASVSLCILHVLVPGFVCMHVGRDRHDASVPDTQAPQRHKDVLHDTKKLRTTKACTGVSLKQG